jgi:kynureninase
MTMEKPVPAADAVSFLGGPFTLDAARAMDTARPGLRARFAVPRGPDGTEVAYFAGHSLGLMPLSARDEQNRIMDEWARLGVEGHFAATPAWADYSQRLKPALGRLVGAAPDSVAVMNTLTVNIHAMLAAFYRPKGERTLIITDTPNFPSDTYALKSHLKMRGFDPATTLIEVRPPEGHDTLAPGLLVEAIEKAGDRLALVFTQGLNYFTGQLYALGDITEAAHRVGALVGFDLAHCIGNVPVYLDNWGTDFAVWCHYKYVNAGPGAIGGAYIHPRHHNTDAVGMAGWWGVPLEGGRRFRMHLEPEFAAIPNADGFQVSTPPLLSIAPLTAALALFDEAGGIEALRKRSQALTAMLEHTLLGLEDSRFHIITPPVPTARGAALSLAFTVDAKKVQQALHSKGITCDMRQPNVIRLAPAPLYNSFEDVFRCALALRQALADA